MPDAWPWPGEDALTRARRVAEEYRRRLQRVDPVGCEQLDELVTRLGQTWVAGVEVSDGDVLTTAEAAEYLGITPRGVRIAVQRGGLVAAGQDDDGYLFERRAVITYLATRRRGRPVAQSDRSPVPSNASG